MHDLSFDDRAYVQEELLVPWTALYLWPRDRKSAVWLHCMGLVASNHLRTSVFVSGEPVSEARIRTTGVGPDTEDHES